MQFDALRVGSVLHNSDFNISLFLSFIE